MASREKKLVGNKFLALKKDVDSKTVKLTPGKQEGVVRKLGRPPKCKDLQSNIVRAKKCIWKHRPKLGRPLGRPKSINKSIEHSGQGVGKSANDGVAVEVDSNKSLLELSPPQPNCASENDVKDQTTVVNKQETTNSTDTTINKETVKVKKRFKKRLSTVIDPSPKPKKLRAKVSNPDESVLGSLNSTQASVPSLAPPKKLGRPSLKVKKSITANTLSTVNLEARNGTRPKVRPSPYTTRSGVPPQLLRNGKRRKFKEPMGGIDAQTPKTKRRRRLLSTTTDGSNVDSLNDPFVEEQAISRIGSESDSSFLDSFQMENGAWDSDVEMKPLDACNKERSADTSRPYINGEPSKVKENISETFVGNHLGKPAERKIDVLLKKTKSLRDGDNEIDEVFDVLSTADPNSVDNPQKTDSNSNLCAVNKRIEETGKDENTSTNNINVVNPKVNKVMMTKKCKGEDRIVNAEISSEVTACISAEGTSKNVETTSLGSDRIERGSSPNSMSTGTDRAVTPSENWETTSVTSTPSSKNFDASFDDVSERDTDCENGKEIRRSQRSSIRKSRAALLRLATRKKRTGKTVDRSGDSIGDIQLAIGGVFVSPARDEIGLAMKDIKMGEINNQATSKTEVTAAKKISKENVDNVIENQSSMCSVAKVIESVVGAQVGTTKMPLETKQCRKLNLVHKRSLKAIERRRRVKSLNTHDIVHLVQNDLCTMKERRASDFGLGISDKTDSKCNSDNSTVPQGNTKLNKPRKYKLKRSLEMSSYETSKSCAGKNVLGPVMPAIKVQHADFGIGSSEKNGSSKSDMDNSTMLQSNKKFNKPRRYKLKRSQEVGSLHKIFAEGSKSEGAKSLGNPNKKVLITDASSVQSELCSLPGAVGKTFLKSIKKPFPRVLPSKTTDQEVVVIEARLKKTETEVSISKVESKDETKVIECVSTPVKSAVTLDMLRDEDMAEKLRELSKKIESESDMFPSLYVKPLIPLSLKMEPNENCIGLKKELKVKTLETKFKDNKSMPVLKRETQFGVIESKREDSKLDKPPNMEKMETVLESTCTVLATGSPTVKDDTNISTSRPTIEDTNMPAATEDTDIPTSTEDIDTPIASKDIDTPIASKDTDTPTATENTDTPTATEDTDTPTDVKDTDTPTCTEVENASEMPVDILKKDPSEKEPVSGTEMRVTEISVTEMSVTELTVKEMSVTEISVEHLDVDRPKEESTSEENGNASCASTSTSTVVIEEKKLLPLSSEEPPVNSEEQVPSIEPVKELLSTEKETTVTDVLNGAELSIPTDVLSIEKDLSVKTDGEHLEVSDEGSSPTLGVEEKISEVSEKDTPLSDTYTRDTKVIDSEKKRIEEETPENMAIKETILSALGLLSLEAAKAAKIAKSSTPRTGQVSNYTGTLKTIIKVQRSPEKRTRPLKMILKHNKPSKRDKGYDESEMNGFQYSICKDAGPSTDDPGTSSSVGVGNRKCLKPSFSYRSYFDISSNPQLFVEDTVPAEPVEQETGKEGEKKQLVIPEKASSFSIHPGRLCSDVCSYCFGKFGSLDTPCHVAQLKGSERQVKILQAELHLTADSCLCDACYRHVDRKANCPTYREKTKGKKRLHHMSRAARPKATCCVLGCVQTAQHHVRRKWLTKLKRSIGKKVPVINNKLPPHVPLPLCSQHYAWVDHFMICGICRRRLNCNQMYPLGPEVHEINTILATDRIPVTLVEKVFLCKLCRYFTSLRTKFVDKTRLTGSNKMFYESYRKKILQFLDVEITEEPELEVPKRKRRKMKVSSKMEVNGEYPVIPPVDKKQAEAVPVINLTSSEDSSPPSMDISSMVETQLVEPMIDYSTLGTDAPSVVSMASISRPSIPTGNYRVEPVKPTKIRLTFGNTKPGPSSDGKKSNNLVILERDPEVPTFSSVLETPQLSVTANFDFRNPITVKSDAEGEWEKCAFSLQYDRDSKQAFEKLKRPYGSQSSFFRHLLLLEQYWRSGELMAAPTSNSRTKSYLKSVQNRIDSFSMSVPSTSYTPIKPKVQSVPTSSVPIIDLPLRRLSGGIVTTASSSRPPTFTCTSTGSMPSASVTNPMFVSQVPPTKKYVINPATGQYVPAKRKPNIVQVTKGGQPLFRLVDPTKSQIRALQGYKRKVPTATVTSDNECVPLICDVRSLGEEGTKLWNTKPTVNVVAPVTNQPVKQKVAISILPKPPMVGPKPNTVLTPTGIILSKKLDISVSPIVKKDDLAKS